MSELPRADHPLGRPAGRDEPATCEPIGRIRDRLLDRIVARGLRPARSLSDGDFFVPLADAAATAAHVLAFYQDRIDDEAALCTARDPRSVLELVAPLGVAPAPPLSARTLIAFEVLEGPTAGEGIELPPGTAIQSVPEGGQPQVFETSEPLTARRAWNRLLPVASARSGGARLWGQSIALLVRGLAPTLKPGSRLLVSGDLDGAPWSRVVDLSRVGRAPRRGLTVLAWDEPLMESVPAAVLRDVVARPLGARRPVFGAGAKPWSSLPVVDRLPWSAPEGGLCTRASADRAPWRQGLVHPAGLEVTALFVSSAGVQLAGVAGKGVYRSDDGGEAWVEANDGLRREEVLCFAEEPGSGALLAGTRGKGVLRSADGRSWTPLRGATAVKQAWPVVKKVVARLPSTPVRCLLPFATLGRDGARNYVVAGTDSGAFWFEPGAGAWTPLLAGLPVSTSEDTASISIRAIASRAGAILVATERGVFACERLGEDWVRADPGQEGASASAVAVDPSGTIVVALDDGGLYRSYDGVHFAPLTPATGDDPFEAASVRSLQLLDGAWYAATDRGLFASRDRGASWSDLSEALPTSNVTCLAVTAEGGLVAWMPLTGTVDDEWPGFSLEAGALDLATEVPPIGGGARVVVEQAEPHQQAIVAVARSVDREHRGFGLDRRGTRLELVDDADLSNFDRRAANVYLPGRALRLADRQLAHPDPIRDPSVELGVALEDPSLIDRMTSDDVDVTDAPSESLEFVGEVPDLAGRTVAIRGRPYGLLARRPLEVQGASGQRLPVAPGVALLLLSRPVQRDDGSARVRVRVPGGLVGLVDLGPGDARLVAAPETSPQQTIIRVVRFTEVEGQRTRIWLSDPFDVALDLDTMEVLANVVPAVHGQTSEEVLGSGDAGRAGQEFVIRQQPLSWHEQDGAPTCQLEVLVQGTPWRRVEHLDRCGPDEQVYRMRVGHDGRVRIRFGDGWRGARLPTGAENVVARYRLGAGPDGNTAVGRIRMLRDAPPRVRKASNVVPATGGEPREDAASLRRRVFSSTRTLGRVVSLADFEDFVASLRGVDRVDARTLAVAGGQRIVISVATTDAEAEHRLEPSSPLAEVIRGGLAAFRFEGRGIAVVSYRPQPFRLAVALRVEPGRTVEAVVEAARAAALTRFTYGRRCIGQQVTVMEIVALLTELPGVLDARVLDLSPGDAEPAPTVPARIEPSPASYDPVADAVSGAEMLLLDPEHLRVEVTR